MHRHMKQTGMKVRFRIKEYAQTAGGFDVLLELFSGEDKSLREAEDKFAAAYVNITSASF